MNPFVAIYEVWSAVGVDKESAVECGFLRWQVNVIAIWNDRVGAVREFAL